MSVYHLPGKSEVSRTPLLLQLEWSEPMEPRDAALLTEMDRLER